MERLRILAPPMLAAALAAFAAGCQTPPTPKAQAEAPPPAKIEAQAQPDPDAHTVVAEMALQKGDCRTAADTYAAAAKTGTAALASRATKVALECEDIPAAWTAVQRWHEVAPADHDATILYATVALKLYHVSQARAAAAPLVKTTGARADREVAALITLLIQETDASATLEALDPSLDAHAASARELSAFGQLALEAYDFGRAERRSHEALAHDSQSVEALALLARVRVLRGDSAGAIATAREIQRVDSAGGKFELAEIFTELDRTEEARQELERLRASGAASPDEVDRRLALLAYQSGDMTEARRRFTDLVQRGEASEAALFYLAEIAERTGDPEAALSAYRQLSDSPMALSARVRAAGILLESGKRAEALELLDGYESEHPESGFELALERARLLAEHHDADGGVTVLSSALERYPHHPTLEYERAMMLERAGHSIDAEQAFEELLAKRPDDPNLQNALGYTLADHGQALPRAESLIRRALSVMPDNPAVLDSLAWVRVRRGDPGGATPTLERAYAISRDPEIAAHWGEALWLAGNQPQARKVWAEALARHPESEELKATLHRLLPPGHP